MGGFLRRLVVRIRSLGISPGVSISLRHWKASPIHAQWKSRALLTNLLIAPLAVMVASSANAQISITPPVAGPPFNLLAGTTYTVISGPNPTNTTGNVFVA